MSKLEIDFSEIEVDSNGGLTGSTSFLSLDERGDEISASLSREEYHQLVAEFSDFVDDMYKAKTLADVEDIQEKLNGICDKTILEIRSDKRNVRNRAILTFYIDDIVFSKFIWNLLLPESVI